MFPSILLFFIFIIVIDVILKSIRDKQKIELEKAKRSKRKDLDTPTKMKDFRPKEDMKIDYNMREEKLVEDSTKYSLEMKPWDEPLFPQIDDKKTAIVSKTKTKDKRKRLSSEQIKKDIIKGVVYSEILQEPVSIRNRRKSM